MSYRRVGSTTHERDGSGLVGLHWLHSRGWLQVNASRFFPGDSPTLNSMLPDRSGALGPATRPHQTGAGVRWVGGVPAEYRCGAAMRAGYKIPRSDGTRLFAGVRTQVNDRSTLTFRVESGDRISRYVTGRQDVESDTGMWSADWQTAINRMNGSYGSRTKQCIERQPRRLYTQRDIAGQVFFRMSTSAQVFARMTTTHTADEAGGGSASGEAGGGGSRRWCGRGSG